jgi:hypothetical protein
MKNKNNATFPKVAVLALLPYAYAEVVVPCKFVRNNCLKGKIISSCILPLEKQEKELEAKNTGDKSYSVCIFFRFRKNGKTMIALKGSIFSPVYFFYFVIFKL